MPKPPMRVVETGPWSVIQREAHSQVWSASITETDAAGHQISGRRSFVELASGLNYQDETGAWQPTREEFQINRDGFAIARFGPHQLIVANNLNAPDAIDFLSSDGVRLRSGPLAIGYYDPTDGNTLVLASVKDCLGELTAPNAVTFKDAFEGLSASVRITYRRAGITSDLILHEAPPDPLLLGLTDRVRLELYTEFMPDTPAPSLTARLIKGESDPAIRQAMVEPDLVDQLVDFGGYKMGAGVAFQWEGAIQTPRLAVAKTFQVIGGHPILIEAVEWKEARDLLAALPKANKKPGTESKLLASTLTKKGQGQSVARLLPVRLEPEKLSEPIRQAFVDPQTRVKEQYFVLDYSLVTGATDFTFAGDTTFFIKDDVYLYGATVLGAGAVLKYTNDTVFNSVRIRGSIDCQTGPYANAILTSQDDNTVGETLPWSSGTPTGTYGKPALQIDSWTSGYPANLHHLRIAYARAGIEFYTGTGHVLKHVQFVHCEDAISPYYCSFKMQNALVYDAGTVFEGTPTSTCAVEHLTVDQADVLSANTSLTLTNCLLVSVLDNGAWTGAGSHNSSTSSTTVFETVGAGAHYLKNNTYRNIGTAAIDPDLLKELKAQTTFGPQILTNRWMVYNTTLNQTAPRDQDAQDAGYHYDPLDYVVSMLIVSNCTLTINSGTAIGTFGASSTYGLALWNGGHILCEGSATNLNVLARYNMVQEQANTNWSAPSIAASLYTPWWEANPLPSATFRFTRFSMPAGPAYNGMHIHGSYGVTLPVTIKDCQVQGGWLYSEQPNFVVENSSFQDTTLYWEDFWDASSHTMRNNLVIRGQLQAWHYQTGAWTFKDNAFDRTLVQEDGVYGLPLSHSHNAYVSGSSRLAPPNANDVLVASFPYASGALGRWYQPASSVLLDAGSQTSAAAGLAQHTCTVDNVKDASTVDIGFHYVAANAAGFPVDSDGDFVADYLEDVNGNGVQDAGEFSIAVADTDNDGDGLSNEQEATLVGTSVVNDDTDGNGVGDYYDDQDGDLLSNAAEILSYGSNPQAINSMLASVTDATFFHAAPLGIPANPSSILLQPGVSPQFIGNDIKWIVQGAPLNTVWTMYFLPELTEKWMPWLSQTISTSPQSDFQNLDPQPSLGFFQAGITQTASGVADSDGDGLTDGFETVVSKTGVNNPDSDMDGVSDGPLIPSGWPSITAANDAFPLNAAASVDTDGDGMPDGLVMGMNPMGLIEDPDDDNDGMPDSVEMPASGPQLSDPLNPDSLPAPTFFVDARYVPPPGARDGSKALPFATIQDALNNLPPASPTRYDVIQVERGVYCGPGNYNIDFGGRNVILVALRGSEETIIDGGVVLPCDPFSVETCGAAPTAAVAFNFHSGEGNAARVIGFTIRNLPASAIKCENASPVIMNCVLINNAVSAQGGPGGGFRLANSSPVILNCTVADNGNTSAAGGGLYAENSSNPLLSHCTFTGNMRTSGQGQLHARTVSKVRLNNCVVWSAAADAELVPSNAQGGDQFNLLYCDVRGGANYPAASYIHMFVLNANPALESSGRLPQSSPAKDRGTTNGLAGFAWAVRYDRDGEARLQDSTPNPFYTADIGSDEYVYRLQFPVVSDSDGEDRPKLNQAGQLVECDILGSQADEASGVAFLGNDGSGRAVIAVVDDEQEKQFFICTLNAAGTAFDAITPIGTTNLTTSPQYTGSDRQLLDLEGITFDENSLDLYLISSNTKARRYRGVENKLLDPMVYSPTNDYDRRRHVLLKLHLNANLTSVALDGYRFYEPEDVAYPNNIYFNPARGLIATIRNNLNAAPYTAQTYASPQLLVAWNTEDKFGTPADGTSYGAGNLIPGGGTVLNVYATTTTTATHGGRMANTWYYYKTWLRTGATVANYRYTEFMTASAQTRTYHTLFINEFVAESTGANVDWIELFNPMNIQVSLNNYRIRCSPAGQSDYMNIGSQTTFDTSPPSVPADGFRQLLANDTTPPSGVNLNFKLSKDGEQIILRPPTPLNAEEIDHWVFGGGQRNDQSEGRAWDGGPSGMLSKPQIQDRVREAVKYQATTSGLLPTTPQAANHGAQRNSFIAAATNDNATINLSWRWRTQSPAVWDYSPKLHDGHALNIEAVAYRPLGGGLANPEMIIGLRSPLSTDRTTGNALYFRVNNVAAFLPVGGWTAAATGLTGPHLMDLNDQGIRSIEWCPGIGPGGVGRYLIVGGPADGGPLEKERFGERFSLYSWDGNVATTPTRLITDLRPYTVRPEGMDLIVVGGQSRVMFVEDRFLAQGYGTRNAIHWPASILTSEVAIP